MGQCLSLSESDAHWVTHELQQQQENNPNHHEYHVSKKHGLFRSRKKNKRHTPQTDPMIYNVQQRKQNKGQSHLLYKKHHKKDHGGGEKQSVAATSSSLQPNTISDHKNNEHLPATNTTKLLKRMNLEDGTNHIYAVRSYSSLESAVAAPAPEQRPERHEDKEEEVLLAVEPNTEPPPAQSAVTEPPPQSVEPEPQSSTVSAPASSTPPPPQADDKEATKKVDIYSPQAMAALPTAPIADLVCVSKEHSVYVCDTGLSSQECDDIVLATEQACRGHYAAYTYAKQTLGCREYESLSKICLNPVHIVSCTIQEKLDASHLVLDDREPHLVKYDVSKKERQKLDMHTDKSEWTFLIALSDGCGLDYDGGGTYFESLEATVHLQRGHALIFPGKLRHCGRKITKGLRFLLVGFLVDKTVQNEKDKNKDNKTTTTSTTTGEDTTTTVTTTTTIITPPTSPSKKDK